MELEILNSSNYSETLKDINVNHVSNQSTNKIITSDLHDKNCSDNGFKNSKHH